MRTFVAFNGLTGAESVAAVPDSGAAGFLVGAPASPRNVELSAIPPLIEQLASGAEAWAIVVDPTAADIHRLFDEVGVDRVEVHGPVPEGLEFLEIHHLIPALPVPLLGEEGPDPKVPPAEDYPRLLLDAPGRPVDDGHARRPNWETCARLVDSQPGRKLVLSGGLDAGNVAEAVQLVRPWGVAVTASIERSPGQADPARMRAFLEAVERAEG